MNQCPFSSREIFPGVFHITGGWCDCYLLIGDEEAVMIDAGCREHNIRAYAQSLTEKPVERVINTHSHIDHTGGNGYFDVIYGTAGIARSGKNVMGGNPADFPLDYQYTIVKDGDILEINGRPLEIITLDSHSPENIAILDKKARILFPGDEVEVGQVLLLPGYAEQPGQIHSRPASSVETFLRAMGKLKKRSGDFDRICPAHNGAPLGNEYIEKFVHLAKGIMDGSIAGKSDCSSPSYSSFMDHFPNPGAFYLRGEYQGASLVYCEKLLRDADYAWAAALPPATRLHVMSAATARQ